MKLYLLIFFSLFSFTLFAQDVATLTKQAEKKTQQGDYKGAIEDYTKVIALDADNLNAFYKRGFAYSLVKDYASAVNDYTSVLAKNPNFLWAYISRGSAYNKLQKYTEALTDFNKALAIDAQNQEAYNNRGWAKKGLGDDAGACEDWKESKKMGNEEAKIILKNSGCK